MSGTTGAGGGSSSAIVFAIDGDSPLCAAVRAAGFAGFPELARHVAILPYGRIDADSPVDAVLTVGRGTCSTKHRLLAAVAHQCGHVDIALTVGIYLMSEENTPAVAPVLSAAGVAAIPEAHCYLTRAGERFDFTGLRAGIASPFDALLEEHIVDPAVVLREKPLLHRRTIDAWSALHGLSPDDAWSLRERCIEALAADTET